MWAALWGLYVGFSPPKGKGNYGRPEVSGSTRERELATRISLFDGRGVGKPVQPESEKSRYASHCLMDWYKSRPRENWVMNPTY